VSDIKPSQTRPKLEFQFRNGTHFRVIYVDGAVGGVMPTGQIHMAIYNDRFALPQKLASPTGEATAEIDLQADGGPHFIREIEAHLVFSLESAVGMRDWLDDKIRRLEAARRQARANN
jgi:hypothetical protein